MYDGARAGIPEAIVVGGGVMGLAAAWQLHQRGHSVTLLERAQPGKAASWASAGIIGATVRSEGDPGYALRRLSRELWPSFAQDVLDASGLDPEYREMGCIHLATNADEMDWLHEVSAHGEGGTLLDAEKLRELEPALSPALPGGLQVSGGNVDNRRLCRALEIGIRRAGVAVVTGAEVVALDTTGGKVSGVQVRGIAESGSDESSQSGISAERRARAESSLRAEMVVIAAGAWSSTIDGLQPRPAVSRQRGQILALDHTRVGIRHVLLTPDDPYFVPRSDGRLVVGATREESGWDASLTAEGIAWLLNRALHVAPPLKSCPILEMWTGFRPVSRDGMPLIGKGAVAGLYFLTGHGPSGIAPLPGSIALLMALIDGEQPPISPTPFDPLRFLA